MLVSEFMLQQTQVDRVVPAFERFLAQFPTLEILAAAPSGAVVRAWSGLGYNARAVRLHSVARVVCERFGGSVPQTISELAALPGVGAYTASAILAFAFDADEVALDTNVRRVLQRVYFGIDRRASAAELERAGKLILRSGSGYETNSALMDLGATICTARAPRCLVCPLQRFCRSAPLDAATLEAMNPSRHRKAERFEDTNRFLRGRIVAVLSRLAPHQSISLLQLHAQLANVTPARTVDDVSVASLALAGDGVITFDGERVSLLDESH